MTRIIAFCSLCKMFHEYQDQGAHIVLDNIFGKPIWEPLVIPIETPSYVFQEDEDRFFEYTLNRLNKILKDAKNE